MGGLAVAPLPGWNVRGYSYGERQADGELHPGADLNVGYGDEDLGVPVVSFAAGTVVYRGEWNGVSTGYGNYGLIEHAMGELRLWSLYAHLDGFEEGFRVGAPVAAGQRIGACGKSGWQKWAHLHFEVRYVGPPSVPAWFWGGRLDAVGLSECYADPFTVMTVLGAMASDGVSGAGGVVDVEAYEALAVDRDYNFRLKMAFEHELRVLEGKRRVKRGTVERLILAAVLP